MELQDTITMMNSSDYKERFKAEYTQLYICRRKLSEMITKYMNGTLSFTPSTHIGILMSQCAIMDSYLAILKTRAEIEHIEL